MIDEPRGQLHAGRQHEDLPVRAVGDAGDLGADLAHARGDLPAHGVDKHVVDDAVATAALCLEDAAVAGDRDDAIERGLPQHGLGKTGLAQQRDL
jgi:hypothetical protein